MKGLKLPSGVEARSRSQYYLEWMKIIEPIERATGWECFALDPGIVFRDGSTGEHVELTTNFARALCKALAEKALPSAE